MKQPVAGRISSKLGYQVCSLEAGDRGHEEDRRSEVDSTEPFAMFPTGKGSKALGYL